MSTTNDHAAELVAMPGIQAQPAPEPASSAPAVRGPSANAEAFDLAQRQAKALAASDLVPQNYRGNLPNVLLAMEVANRIGASPLAVMQSLHIVQGRPSWSASFLIGTVNACGRFSPLRFETRGGDDAAAMTYACRAIATDLQSGVPCVGAWITWAMVEAEGWSKKSGSKWMTMPEQMFMYRAAAFWGRVYAPEISLGIHTADEVEDFAPTKTAPVATSIRFSPSQMAKAKAEIASGNATAEVIAERYPTLAADQKEEIATWIKKSDEE